MKINNRLWELCREVIKCQHKLEIIILVLQIVHELIGLVHEIFS